MIDRAKYESLCAERWHSQPLLNAKRNFADFSTLTETLREALHEYRRDPCLTDLTGKRHNPSGKLSDMLWNLQANLNPDRSSLWPLLDFEEHHQTIFLRRGLTIFCGLLLDEMRDESFADPAQEKLFKS